MPLRQDFMVRNNIPMAAVLGTWRVNESDAMGPSHNKAIDVLVERVLDAITSGRIFDENPDAPQPFFLKCCHLTQGSAHSVRHFRREDVTGSASKREELRQWLLVRYFGTCPSPECM